MRSAAAVFLLALVLTAPATAAPGPQGLDARFASCGRLTPAPLASLAGRAAQVERAPDGSIVVAGTLVGDALQADSFAVARFSPAGVLDKGFGSGGVARVKVRRPTGEQNAEVTGLLVQADGKVVVGGYVAGFDNDRAVLARLEADGDPDPLFGSAGVVEDAVPSAGGGRIGALAQAADGTILVAGTRDQNEGARFVVLRYRPAGGLDPAFGTGGSATVDSGLGSSSATAIAVRADGEIVAAGQAGEQFALVRMLANGDLLSASYESPPASAGVRALSLLVDGRIVVAGRGTNINGRDLVALGRYTTDGRPDPAFGSDGFVMDRGATAASGLAVDESGRLLVAATSGFTASGLVRYSADGARDAGFGLDGSLVGFGSYMPDAGDVVVESGGTAVVPLNNGARFGVVRFALDEPALAATASQPRVCSARVTTKSLTQLLRRGTTARFGKLGVALSLRQPGNVRVSAVARVGGRSARVGAATVFYTSFGKAVATVQVSRAAARLLRPAKSAEITLTAVGTDGGGSAFTGTRTLKRR
ncbi:MAG: hypothetical protein QOJ57_1990 [Thermoleophilaceae bacterium]|nr:hypothetical protein [Thermoleophilaceae bacterium]